MPIIDPDRDPGLNDGLSPYQRAQSWLYMMWMDVYQKCMTMLEQQILDAGGTLGGGKHAVSMGFSGAFSVSTTVIPPGPVNPFGKAIKVKKVYIYANDAIGVTFDFGSYSLGGAGSDSDTSLNWSWGDEVQLTWSVTMAGATLTSFGWTIEAEE